MLSDPTDTIGLTVVYSAMSSVQPATGIRDEGMAALVVRALAEAEAEATRGWWLRLVVRW
ncbi:hypothetical protein GCM10010446_25160 [Streptomyces enissocaesilis]|uniref:Uncharacterized protein n=1 Tax=Streptomyces enissocaesilis TaxID=332589 RepID=A0ABP6JQK4_9ACTN